MSETIDPITLLRDTIQQKKEITFNEQTNEIVFTESGLKLPKDVQTAWKRKDDKGYYNLGTIWFCIANKDLKQPDYITKVNKSGFQLVQYSDRKDIVDYFTGEITQSNQIDETIRSNTLISKSQIKKGKIVQGQKEQLKKRDVKAEEKKELKFRALDHLLINERKIAGRATAIQCQNRSFLKVLQLAYAMTGQEKKANEVKERIEQRQTQIMNGQIKQKVQIVDVEINILQQKGKKKRSLLEEIIKSHHGGFSKVSKPIIIVPASLQQGNLGLQNVKKFLQDGQYSATGDVETKTGGGTVEIVRKINGESITFEVHDNVQSFTNNHWKNVVAVFVNGQEWQFKDWPDQAKKVEMFMRVRGYYLHYQDQNCPEITQKWNIKILTLQRNKRHQDVSVYNEFWSDLENFLKKEKFAGLSF